MTAPEGRTFEPVTQTTRKAARQSMFAGTPLATAPLGHLPTKACALMPPRPNSRLPGRLIGRFFLEPIRERPLEIGR